MNYLEPSLRLLSTDIDGIMTAAASLVSDAAAKSFAQLHPKILANRLNDIKTQFAISHWAPVIDTVNESFGQPDMLVTPYLNRAKILSRPFDTSDSNYLDNIEKTSWVH